MHMLQLSSDVYVGHSWVSSALCLT